MLETIREYAGEQLEQRGETELLGERHAEYFLALAEETARGAPDPVVDGGHLRHDLDNLRSALEWFVGASDAESELRLATAAFWISGRSPACASYRVWLGSALERASDADSRLRGDGLGAAALAAANLGEGEDAREYARESLALARERDDQRQIEWALRVSASTNRISTSAGGCCRSASAYRDSATSRPRLGHLPSRMALMDEGRFKQARDPLEQAARIFAELGKRWEATNAEIEVGYALVMADRHRRARSHSWKARSRTR